MSRKPTFSRPTNVVEQDGIDQEAPLDWLMEDGEVNFIIEVCYRYAAYTKGVTTVMNGAHDISWMVENARSVLKGPLSEPKRKRLQDIFGKVAEAIGN